MFDGPTTVDVEWYGPLVAVDFSQLLDDDGRWILMACASAWIQTAVMRPGVGARWLVLDEAWRSSATWGPPDASGPAEAEGLGCGAGGRS